MIGRDAAPGALRALAARQARAKLVLLTGFEPFGGERRNPSWEVARRLDGQSIGGLTVAALLLPVAHRRAIGRLLAAIRRLRPAAVLGLGQAGGRPALSLERVAINLVAGKAGGAGRSRRLARPVVLGGPDAYFSRMPLEATLSNLNHRRIPAALSLSAGDFICNAVMYAGLHQLRRRPAVPVGFIHLPYEPRQAARQRGAASMSLDLMERAVAIAIETIAHAQQ